MISPTVQIMPTLRRGVVDRRDPVPTETSIHRFGFAQTGAPRERRASSAPFRRRRLGLAGCGRPGRATLRACPTPKLRPPHPGPDAPRRCRRTPAGTPTTTARSPTPERRTRPPRAPGSPSRSRRSTSSSVRRAIRARQTWQATGTGRAGAVPGGAVRGGIEDIVEILARHAGRSPHRAGGRPRADDPGDGARPGEHRRAGHDVERAPHAAGRAAEPAARIQRRRMPASSATARQLRSFSACALAVLRRALRMGRAGRARRGARAACGSRALSPVPLPPGSCSARPVGDPDRGWADGLGKTPSIWDVFAALPGRIADGSTPDVAADRIHRWAEDVALLRELGVDAYRFSLSWSRVQPNGAGPAGADGVAYYDRLVDALLAASIEPHVACTTGTCRCRSWRTAAG